MTNQIVRFSYVQNTKLAVVFYALIGFIYVPIGLGLMFFGPADQRLGAVLFLFMPVVLAVFGGIFVPIMIAVYNVIAKFVGGIEYTTTEQKNA
jgi:hypothetical protein